MGTSKSLHPGHERGDSEAHRLSPQHTQQDVFSEHSASNDIIAATTLRGSTIQRDNLRRMGRNYYSFSGRSIIHWLFDPSIFAPGLSDPSQISPREQQSHLEFDRSPFDTDDLDKESTVSADWLFSLNLSFVQMLSNAYFATFNRTYPIIDSEYYFSEILGSVIQDGFNYDVKSCVVLGVLALGCWGHRGIIEGGFTKTDQVLEHTSIIGTDDGAMKSPLHEDPPGIGFFNQFRRRMGFLLCDQSVQVCQLYHLCALYYEQLMRPMDDWMMTDQACRIVRFLCFSKLPSFGEYDRDVFGRLFWCSLMRETVLVDELGLPSNTLQDLEAHVPLPKFVQYRSRGSKPHRDEMYHAHFLAQCALRLILSRIRNELYHTKPSIKLAEELFHQLEQWQFSLPTDVSNDFEGNVSTHTEAARMIAVCLLQCRACITAYHIGRPFLFKAITTPEDLTDREFEICELAMGEGAQWFRKLQPCLLLDSMMPLKFSVCGQYVSRYISLSYGSCRPYADSYDRLTGQLLLGYMLRAHPCNHLSDIVPQGFDAFQREAMQYLQEKASRNPTIARDARLVALAQSIQPQQSTTRTLSQMTNVTWV